MNIFFFVLLSGLAFQLSVSSLLPAIRTGVTKTVFSSPQNLNTNQRTGCSNCLLRNLLCGVVRTVGGKILTNLCCDCTPEPVKKCPEFKCMALQCPNGERPTFFPDGCRGCNECVPEINTTTPEPESTTTPEPECSTSSEPECTTTPEPECSTRPPCKKLLCIEPNCAYGKLLTFFPNGCPGCPVCKSAPTTAASEPEVTTTPEPEVTTTPEPEVTTTLEPECTTTPEATTTSEPECSTTPEPEVMTTPEPECSTTLEPESITTPEPEVTTTLEPECTTTSEPEVMTTSEPEVMTTPEPECATSEPEVMTTSEPEVMTTPEPECATTPEPEVTTTTKKPCKKMLCIVPKCLNGTIETLLPNGCPGCPVCMT
ncbi:proteoglycan 4-like [Bradysia coprophila]|uniref:proteoglycan 4-like n=1 Tax=Bradysia coprophila TaxID=38358 RepID=UPI00187DD6D3|nr:proteoglycan 4-like [Bradysia coprophila]